MGNLHDAIKHNITDITGVANTSCRAWGEYFKDNYAEKWTMLNDAMAQPIVPSTSLIEVEGDGTIEPPRFLTTNDMISLPQNMTFRCAVCGRANAQGHAAALVMANPYSRWAILQCRACSEA